MEYRTKLHKPLLMQVIGNLMIKVVGGSGIQQMKMVNSGLLVGIPLMENGIISMQTVMNRKVGSVLEIIGIT